MPALSHVVAVLTMTAFQGQEFVGVQLGLSERIKKFEIQFHERSRPKKS